MKLCSWSLQDEPLWLQWAPDFLFEWHWQVKVYTVEINILSDDGTLQPGTFSKTISMSYHFHLFQHIHPLTRKSEESYSVITSVPTVHTSIKSSEWQWSNWFRNGTCRSLLGLSRESIFGFSISCYTIYPSVMNPYTRWPIWSRNGKNVVRWKLCKCKRDWICFVIWAKLKKKFNILETTH